MSKNDRLQFADLRQIVQTVGRLTDQNGNQFQIVAKGNPDRVRTFIETQPVFIEIQPAKEPIEKANSEGQRTPEPREISEEELVQGLFVGISIVTLKSVPPFNIHFVIEPDLSDGLSDYYGLPSGVVSHAKCTTNRGDCNLSQYERQCFFESGGICYASGWALRCRSAWSTTPVDECASARWYTGDWLAQVTAVGDSNYTLSGDIFVP